MIDGPWLVKDIVRDVQETIIRSLSRASESGETSEARESSGSSDVGDQGAPQVTVRVQSLL